MTAFRSEWVGLKRLGTGYHGLLLYETSVVHRFQGRKAVDLQRVGQRQIRLYDADVRAGVRELFAALAQVDAS